MAVPAPLLAARTIPVMRAALVEARQPPVGLRRKCAVPFSPEEFGQFTALNSRTDKVLWHFNTGDLITASPISYSVDGKQ
jgi:hypothetical protein